MTPDDASTVDRTRTDAVPEPRPARRIAPWAEPGRSTPGPRPRTEYWDAETARWTTRSPVPSPRRGS